MSPVIFRINPAEHPLMPRALPSYRNIPIDPTSEMSHLACEDGTLISVT